MNVSLSLLCLAHKFLSGDTACNFWVPANIATTSDSSSDDFQVKNSCHVENTLVEESKEGWHNESVLSATNCKSKPVCVHRAWSSKTFKIKSCKCLKFGTLVVLFEPLKMF